MKLLSILALSTLLAFPAGGAEAAEITVSAAASLTNAFTDIKAAYEKSHPGHTLLTNFAASNPLLQQMREGAPVDVFASADQATMNRAGEEKLVDPATRRNFAANSLALIVPAGGDGQITGVGDLSRAQRLAIGNPDSVPAGRYARDSLRSVKLWDALQPALIQGESVRQVLDYVARGEVDAGIVYGTDAAIAGDKVRVAAPLSGHEPILYPVAVASSVKDKKAAQAFVDYLFSPAGVSILKKYGFTEVKQENKTHGEETPNALR